MRGLVARGPLVRVRCAVRCCAVRCCAVRRCAVRGPSVRGGAWCGLGGAGWAVRAGWWLGGPSVQSLLQKGAVVGLAASGLTAGRATREILRQTGELRRTARGRRSAGRSPRLHMLLVDLFGWAPLHYSAAAKGVRWAVLDRSGAELVTPAQDRRTGSRSPVSLVALSRASSTGRPQGPAPGDLVALRRLSTTVCFKIGARVRRRAPMARS